MQVVSLLLVWLFDEWKKNIHGQLFEGAQLHQLLETGVKALCCPA